MGMLLLAAAQVERRGGSFAIVYALAVVSSSKFRADSFESAMTSAGEETTTCLGHGLKAQPAIQGAAIFNLGSKVATDDGIAVRPQCG